MNNRQFHLLLVGLLLLLLAACQGAPVAQKVQPMAFAALPSPTPERLSVAASPAPVPQIIHQAPLPGERLGLSPTITITFDRPMNTTRTAAAWAFRASDGGQVAGRITWSDSRTFQFKPNKTLEAGKRYTGVFSKQAASADGVSLPEEVRLEYQTTNQLVVGQVFPADGTTEVDRTTAITVIFNKPVAPIGTVESLSSLPSPVEILPQTKGTGNWVSSSVYVFQVEGGLQSNTAYRVTVRGNLKDTTGTALGADYSWSFTTSAPQVMDFALKNIGQVSSDNVENVLLDQAFLVSFTQPMDQASVVAALTLANVETGANFPLKQAWNKDSTVLTLTPVGRFKIASFYNLTIATSARAQDGGSLVQPFLIKLSTIPLPAVVSVYPASGTQKEFSPMASVYFASAMKLESMKDKVKVSPEPKKPVELYFNDYDHSLNIWGLEPSTQYVIRLLPGMTDIYGNAIQGETSFSFETASLSPSAWLLAPYYPLIYHPQSEIGIFLEYTNITSAHLSLYKLDFTQFSALLGGFTPLDALTTSDKQPLRQWNLTPDAARDQFVRKLVHLDETEPLAPGYYYLGLTAEPIKPYHRFLQGVIFIVANDSLTLKATQGEALAWLVDSASGQPVPGVPLIFYSLDNNGSWSVAGKGTTDKNGLVHLADAASVRYVRTDDPAHLALASLDWGSGVNEGQFGIWTDYWSDVKSTFAFVYTERPLYRPGQPVYIKGIVRLNDDLHYSLPDTASVYLTIEGDAGRVFSGDMPLSADGTFAGQYDLSVDAPVGNYFIYVRPSASSDRFLGGADFRVAEYVKPEFALTVDAQPALLLAGEQATFSVDAAYYSGGNLSDAAVSWYMESQPYSYIPPDDYSGYSFSDFDYYDYYYNGQSGTSGAPVSNSGEGQTDANGHFELRQTMNLAKEGVSETVAFSANVSDVGGNLVGGSASLTVLGSALHVGIRTQDYIGEGGKPSTLELVVLDMNGQPVAGQTVRVAFAEQRWFSAIRTDANGVSRWETSVKSIPAGSASAVTDANGLAQVSFTPPNGGEFKATATVLDEKERAAKASTYIWVVSDSYIPWRQTNDRSFQLVADKDSYNPGETAKILIAQPFEGENVALLTVERGHIYDAKVVTLTSNSTVYELPITADMAPVMYFSVMVVKATNGKTPPDFKMGMVRLNVNPSQQQIAVHVESDKVTASPGEVVTYTVTTKDLVGNPVQADVSLALVDEAVLALAPSNSPPLLDAFYPLRGLGVRTASSIVANAADFNANYQETGPDGERGGGGGKGAGDGIVTVRGNFKDTAFWQAQVSTGAGGRAQVKVTLPDNLTTWRMTARAITRDSRVGETASGLLSTRPLQVQLQTPRFFTAGDTVTLGAVIHNNTDKDLTVQVSLAAEGLVLSSDAKQMLTVAAKKQAYVTWQAAVAAGAQRVDLVASVSGGGYSDATRPTLGTLPGQGIPVLTYHVIETVGTSGILRDANSAAEAVTLPSTSYLDASLNLEVSPSLAASMTDGLTYLNDYPYLCMEQTVSRFLPNLVSLEALKLAGKSTDALQAVLDAQVKPALQRIINSQNKDGGWGLWPGTPTQQTTSAYVLLGLLEARKAGYTFPQATLTNGLDYLANNMPAISKLGDSWRQNQAAFMLYVMARGGRPVNYRLNSLYNDRTNLDIYGKALLMQAMYIYDAKDARIQQLLSEINGAAALSAAGAWWSEKSVDYWNWNTDLRTTAIVLNALIQVDPQNALIPDGVRWLMKHRQGTHWYSTQETAWSLMALTHWLEVSQEFKADYQYAIGLNGKMLATRRANAQNLTDTYTLKLGVEDLVANTVNNLVITRGSGPGVLYYTTYVDYSLSAENIPALDQGILVSRQYFRVTDLKTPITEIKRGELVQVRLILVVPDSLHYVVIDDPLPAGLEAVDASLQTSMQVPSAYQPRDYDLYGWGWWYFYYKQIYDEKVVMSADYLPPGTYVINYLARASTAGEFRVLPLTAKEFYFPDVAGRSAGSLFVVKP
jgi:uncharacterized protein YfaS (alpha-2-macroglobulin family)